jgi:hypothetical protein
VAIPIKVNDKATAVNPTVIGILLSYLETSHPDSGRPINELMGMQSKMVPSSASLNANDSLMVGIREAHVEKHTPERKKNMLRKIRCLFFASMLLHRVRISGVNH